MLKVVHEESKANENAPAGVGGSLLDELARDGARQMLAAALLAEVAAYVEANQHEVDELGHRLVVRNGFHEPREVATAAGAVAVRQPRVNDKRVDEVTGDRVRFSSAILPAWARKSPQVAEVLPLLYLHGLSTGDFAPALEQFLGSSAGLSAGTITRLTSQWQDEATAFNKRSLAGTDYVYVWVDGIHLKVRLEQDKVCLLVMIGVRADGTKELVALDDGHRESTESWADLLRSAKRRGMRAPVLAVGDGALGFWAAVVRRGLRHQVAQGRRQDHRGPRRPPRVLRLPRRALGPPADHEPDRVDLRHRPAASASHQGTRLTRCGDRDGVQAHRVRTSQMACPQRTPPRRSRPCRRDVQERRPRRTRRRHHRGIRRRSTSRVTRRSTGLDYCSGRRRCSVWTKACPRLRR